MGWRGVSGKLPIQYPGAICHVMNRGDQRGAVFRDDEDRLKLLVTLGEACRKTEWPAVGPFLPRRAICNLENLEGETKAALGLQRRLVGALGANLGLFSVGCGRAGRVFERP